MHRIPSGLLCGLLCCLAYVARAQDYHLRKIGVREGLGSANTFAVFEDRRGFLWVGTDQGASRYDGYQFVNFTDSATGERLGQANTFVEDREGTLWVGTNLGLFVYRGGRFHRIGGFTHGIHALLVSKTGDLWIGASEGVFRYSREQLTSLEPAPERPPEAVAPRARHLRADPRVTALCEMSDGTIFVSTLFYVLRWTGADWQLVWGDATRKPDIMALAETAPGELTWACDETTFYRWAEGRVDSLPPGMLGLDVRPSEHGAYLLSYSDLWRWRDGRLQHLLDARRQEVNWMRRMCFDRHGNIWVATFEGILQLRPSGFQLFAPERFPEVQESYALGEDAAGRLLVGGNQGRVHFFDGRAFQWRFPSKPHLVPQAEIWDIHATGRGELWLATGYQGLVHADSNGKTASFTTADGLGDNSRFFFFHDPWGRLWTGGDGGMDEIRWDEERGRPSFVSYSYDTGTAQYASFFAAVAGPDSSIFLAGNFGLFSWHRGRLAPVQLQGFSGSTLSVTDVIADETGFWLATNGDGLLFGGPESPTEFQLRRQWTTADGLQSNTALRLLRDSGGRLWIATYQGLCRLDERGFIRCYDARDGFLAGSYASMALLEAADGRVWAASTEGLVSFKPAAMPRNAQPPRLYWLGLSLPNGPPVAGAGLSGGSEVITLPTALSLSHTQNHLSFHFTGINLSRPDLTRYRYRLLGRDPQWVHTSYTPTLTFAQLAPGDYTLELAAVNEDGVWSEPLRYHWYIRPPFWRRWWFFAALAALAAALIGLLFREQQRRNAIKQQVVESKLAALQAQMNPHFLSNALNAINYFILENNSLAASRYLTKFSRLVRLILDHSQVTAIPLENELEALRYYLDLEKLRFEDRFDYSIEVAPDLSPRLLQVPPLVIQPFAENAVWHGFTNRDGNGKLHIALFREGEQLRCVIEDNGVGRVVANQLQRERGRKPGQGQRITANRLQLLSQKTHAITITDLYDEAGRARGTRVSIALPLSYRSTDSRF